MSLTATPLAALDPARVAETEAMLTALLQEAEPSLDVRHGVFRDVMLHFVAALLESVGRGSTERLRQDFSLVRLIADPAAVDQTIADQLLGNYRLSRQAGTPAVGEIAVVLSKAIAPVLPRGTRFAYGQQQFITTTTHAIRLSEDSISGATDRALIPLGTGQYVFSVPVAAAAAGTQGMLQRDTAVTMPQPPPYFVRAYAAGDFSDGHGDTTTADLAAQLAEGLAARTWSNRTTITALLRNHAAFRKILRVSIVGAGDAEMRRDQRSLFPWAPRGRCDLYLRSQPLPQIKFLSVSATAIAVTAATVTWQFTLDRDAAPGFYEVLTARDDTQTVAVSEVSRDIAFNGDEWAPDISVVEDGAYSRYQTGTFACTTDVSAAAVVPYETTRDFSVAVSLMPLVAAAQDFLGGRDVRSPGADVLVKAPVPCQVRISVDLFASAADASAIVTDSIRSTVSTAINSLGFVGQLFASGLARAIQDVLPERVEIGRIDMLGRIRPPDGELLHAQNDTVLTIQHLPHRGVTARTVAFFSDPGDIAVNIHPLGAST